MVGAYSDIFEYVLVISVLLCNFFSFVYQVYSFITTLDQQVRSP